jgi:hypothetical protein
MSGKKLISLDALQSLYNQLKSKFATKDEIENKVDKEEGKGLSSNDFTENYMETCDYIVPLKDDGLLILALKGPDGNVYRLSLDDNLRLVLDPYIANRQVRYLISGDDYYYLDEDENGVYLSKYLGEEVPEPEDCGYIRATSKDTGMKFTLSVIEGNVVFNLYEGPAIDAQEAKYLVCDDKICYFVIENDQVEIFYEYLTIGTDMSVK